MVDILPTWHPTKLEFCPRANPLSKQLANSFNMIAQCIYRSCNLDLLRLCNLLPFRVVKCMGRSHNYSSDHGNRNYGTKIRQLRLSEGSNMSVRCNNSTVCSLNSRREVQQMYVEAITEWRCAATPFIGYRSHFFAFLRLLMQSMTTKDFVQGTTGHSITGGRIHERSSTANAEAISRQALLTKLLRCSPAFETLPHA